MKRSVTELSRKRFHQRFPERFALENICRPDPVFRLAGFTPPPELYAASELRLFRRRGFSLVLLD